MKYSFNLSFPLIYYNEEFLQKWCTALPSVTSQWRTMITYVVFNHIFRPQKT